MQPIILQFSQFCQRLDFSQLSEVGHCLVDVSLQGDMILAAILLSVLFGGLIVRYNFPIGLMLPFAMAITYTLWLLTGASYFLAFFMFTMMVGGALLILAILKYINK